MDKLRLIFIGLGLIFTAILLYFAVTLFLSLFWYLAVFGVIALGGYGGYKFLRRRSQKTLEIKQGNPEQELLKAQKTIDDYRRKLSIEKE